MKKIILGAMALGVAVGMLFAQEAYRSAYVRYASTLPDSGMFPGELLVLTGSVSADPLLYMWNANDDAWETIGGDAAVPSITDVTTTNQISIAAGTVGDPSIVVTSDDDGTGTGLYRSAADVLSVANNGVLTASFNTGGFDVLSGTAAAPSLSFTSDDTTGGYLVGAGNMGFSVTGALVFDLEDTNAAGASADLATISASLGIMDGSDTFNGLSVNLTNADHTGSGNEVRAISIGNITGDTEATETGILVGTGWGNSIFITGDAGTNCDAATGSVIAFGSTAGTQEAAVCQAAGGSLVMSSGGHMRLQGGSVATQAILMQDSSGSGVHRFMIAYPSAGSGGNIAQIGEGTTIPALDGTGDILNMVAIDFTNANHTAAGLINAIFVDGITGDAEGVESLLFMGDGFDYFLNDEVDTALGTLTWTTNLDKDANTASGTLRVFINGTLYHIQLYADS